MVIASNIQPSGRTSDSISTNGHRRRSYSLPWRPESLHVSFEKKNVSKLLVSDVRGRLTAVLMEGWSEV